MPATIRPTDMLVVSALLQELHAMDQAPDPSKFTAEEIAHIVQRRRDRIVRDLANKGIEVKPEQVPLPPVVQLRTAAEDTTT